MYADHSLRLAQEIVTKNFFLRLLRQKGKGGGKLRMIQNGGLAAGGKKIFFKLLRLGKLDKLFTHQIIKGNFPFPPPAQLQDFIYGCVTNDYLAKGIECVLDTHLVGFIFGHGNSPYLNNCCRPLIAYQQRRAIAYQQRTGGAVNDGAKRRSIYYVVRASAFGFGLLYP